MITILYVATNRKTVSGWVNKQHLQSCPYNGWVNSHRILLLLLLKFIKHHISGTRQEQNIHIHKIINIFNIL